MTIRGFLSRIAPFVAPYWRLQVIILAAVLADLAFGILVPISYQAVVDRALIGGETRVLFVVIGAIAGVYLIDVIASLAGDYASARLGSSLLADLRIKLFEHFQLTPARAQERINVGDLLSRLSADLAIVQQSVTTVVPSAISAVLMLFGVGAIMALLNWQLALVAGATLAGFAFLPAVFGSRIRKATIELQAEQASEHSWAQASLSTQPAVKAYGLEAWSLSNFTSKARAVAARSLRFSLLGSALESGSYLAAAFSEIVVLAVGAFMVVDGTMTVGSLVAFLLLLDHSLSPIRTLTSLTAALNQGAGAFARVEGLLANATEMTADRKLPGFRGKVVSIGFHDVWMSYGKDDYALRGVSFSCRSGQRVAVVGPNGSGKSTLLSMIWRRYDPSRGRITFNGQDISGFRRDSLRRRIGAVFQPDLAFDLSVLDNVRLGAPNASETDLRRALTQSGADKVLKDLGLRADAPIGDRGTRLSDGQRRRVALARAIVRNPDVILMDEAAAFLDPETTTTWLETIEAVSKNAVVVAAGHELRHFADWDQVVVLSAGRVEAIGPGADVIRKRSAGSSARGASYTATPTNRQDSGPSGLPA